MKNPTPQPKGSIFDIFSDKKKRAHYFSERIIKCNEERMDYPNNTISTGKYNVINFLPKNLFFQFSKLANVYFVIIGMLQLIKQISTSNGTPYIFIPLTVIILVTMIKDLAEDYKRHKSDWEENNKPVKVFKNGDFVSAKWRDIRVGSVVKVEENQFFPADMLIIQSSGKKGLCYVETKNLDGETNLKQKQVHKDVASDFDTEAKIAKASNDFKYEKPNDYLYKFVGYIQTSSGSVALSEPNFVLRGCSLRNTAFIVGVVAYTGHHTKIMLNSIKAKPKLSKLEKNMNRQILLVFAVQLCFCIFSGLYAAIWYVKHEDELGYLGIDRDGVADNAFYYNFFIRLGNWLLLFTNFVPISLLVTLEMVKLFQGVYMTADPLMTAQASQIKTTVQSSNLNEELGQVEYIFSDKTGTLTQNLMEFRNLSVRQKSYGDDRSLTGTANMPQVTNVDFLDRGFIDELNNPKSQNYENIIDCLTLLAVCHTIITEEKDGEIIYNAASPDELALVNFAKFVGAEFAGMDDNSCINVNLKGKILKFQLLHVLEFNSTRKRMSVIVKQPDGKVVLMTKGADTILFGLMDRNDPAIATTMEHLTNYSKKGLRTLVLAKRVLDNAKYLSWANRYQEASIKIEGRDEAMEALQAEIETDLKLVGATAIDDKLQDEVGITISKIREAGIRLWVLTGDKVETAINIGFSCKLLDNDMKQLEITETTFEQVNASLDEKIDIVNRAKGSGTEFALIISGDALLHAMKPELSKKIMEIAEVCKSVLACRVSPKQKQEIVSLVRREKPHVNTLAIGDGANDVYMITAANVGIGIRGVEGQQAARASDFAIGEFKILRRLLYVYGREAYRRNSYLILYNFYKNMVLVLPQFWFAFVSGFSGKSIYNQIVFQFFNILFASLPIVIYAVFDQEHHHATLMNSPHLYLQGIQNKLFNTAKFWRWFFLGVWESAIIAIFSFGALDNNFSKTTGREYGIFGPGMLVFSNAVWIVNFKIFVMSNTFNMLNIICVILSLIAYVLVFWIISCMSTFGILDFFSELFSAQNFYIGSAVCIAVTYFFHIGYSRYDTLINIAKNKSISPEEKAIQKLLADSPPIHVEMGSLNPSKKESLEEYDNSRSEIIVGRPSGKRW